MTGFFGGRSGQVAGPMSHAGPRSDQSCNSDRVSGGGVQGVAAAVESWASTGRSVMVGMLPVVYTQPSTGGVSSLPAAPLTLCEREKVRVGIEPSDAPVGIAERLSRHRCTIS